MIKKEAAKAASFFINRFAIESQGMMSFCPEVSV
jgi:hypothetical protein